MTPSEIRAHLSRHGLSLAAFARLWGVPYRTVQSWMQAGPGHRPPHSQHVRMLAVLDVEGVSHFLDQKRP